MNGGVYELKDNLALHHLFRNRPCPLPRRRDSSIVWPRRPGAVPEIPFIPYKSEHLRKWWAGEIIRLQKRVCDTFRHADAANKRCEDYRDSLNSQRK